MEVQKPPEPSPEAVAYQQLLDALTPDNAAINSDPAFVQYLDGTRDEWGRSLRSIGAEAAGKYDAEMVSNIMERFRREKRGAAKKPVAPPREDVAMPTVEEQAQPPARGSRPPAPAAQAKRKYSYEQWETLSNDVTLGRNGMTGARGKAMDAELVAAMREGRVSGVPAA